MRYLYLIFGLSLGFCFSTNAQDENVFETFKDTRVINTHSVVTLPKRKLDIRIAHRFGDINKGFETLFGLENAADVMIGAEYGFTDKLSVGLFRTKGAGPINQLLNLHGKYALLQQKVDGSMPISLSLLGVGSISTKKKSVSGLTSFPSFSHRLAYTLQVLVARKFSDRLSLQLTPGYTHRNFVSMEDKNDVFSMGVAFRFQISRVYGLILDANIPLAGTRKLDDTEATPKYGPSIGIGLEIDTGGHVFQINLTNSSGLSENDFIPYTSSSWTDGEFRLGFTISRLFNL